MTIEHLPGKLIKTHELSEDQLNALDQLKSYCKQQDGNDIPIYRILLEEPRPFSICLLYYLDQQLIAFLTPFFFEDTVSEISLMVHPQYRRQLVASHLCLEACAFLRSQQINTVVFATPDGLITSLLPQNGFTYRNSEYRMERQSLFTEPLPPNLYFKTATITDIPLLGVLDQACFPGKQANPFDRYGALMQDENYHIILAYRDQLPVGKAHCLYHLNKLFISDIGVFPALQGQGIGKALVAACINEALQRQYSHVMLSVETHNERAVRLYQHLGFIVTNLHEYWTIPLTKIEFLLTDFIQRR